jgi:hypothetical protein
MRTRTVLRLFTLALAVLGVILTLAPPVSADPITVGNPNWYEFTFGGGGSFGTSGTGDVPSSGGNSQYAPNPPWTFSGGPVTVTLTDAFDKGDSFSLFDFGSLVGSTPSVAQANNSTSDPAITSLDPSWSHGIFNLGAGSHSLTIRADNSPFGGGAAFFRVDAAAPTPEPTSLALFGMIAAGSAGYYGWRRRKQAVSA